VTGSQGWASPGGGPAGGIIHASRPSRRPAVLDETRPSSYPARERGKSSTAGPSPCRGRSKPRSTAPWTGVPHRSARSLVMGHGGRSRTAQRLVRARVLVRDRRLGRTDRRGAAPPAHHRKGPPPWASSTGVGGWALSTPSPRVCAAVRDAPFTSGCRPRSTVVPVRAGTPNRAWTGGEPSAPFLRPPPSTAEETSIAHIAHPR